MTDEASADCPGRDRRQPPLGTPTWAVRAPLAGWLRGQARAAAEAYGRYRVLDVGSGIKPYYPLFAPFVREFVSVDPTYPGADVHATAESLPLPDGGYEVVLCTQVLEHTGHPEAVVRELHRVTAPGGRVLASTHGVYVYHPNPDDLWRWTHTGLERLFRENGDWASVTVTPGPGTGTSLGMLVATYVHLLFKQVHLAPLARPAVAAVNVLGRAVDALVPRFRSTGPGSLIANYHVLAEKAATGRGGGARAASTAAAATLGLPREGRETMRNDTTSTRQMRASLEPGPLAATGYRQAPYAAG